MKSRRKWEALSEVLFAYTKEAGNPGDGGVALISLVIVSHTFTVWFQCEIYLKSLCVEVLVPGIQRQAGPLRSDWVVSSLIIIALAH